MGCIGQPPVSGSFGLSRCTDRSAKFGVFAIFVSGWQLSTFPCGFVIGTSGHGPITKPVDVCPSPVLFQQHHLLGLSEAVGVEAIKVDSGGHRGTA